MLRDDHSPNLVHFTRDVGNLMAAQAFVSIMKSRSLRGSSKNIRGGHTCIYLTETPIAKLAHLLSTPDGSDGVRYRPFGVLRIELHT